MSKDYMKAFAKLMESNFELYKGYLIRIDGEFFYCLGTQFDSLELAKEAIDKTFPILGNTIKSNPSPHNPE